MAAAIMWLSACGGSETPTSPSAPPSQSATTVRWVGNSPEGMIVEQEAEDYCPAEFDLELNLTTISTAVTGTATTRLRRVEAGGPCGDVLGGVHNYSVANGRIDSDRISFDLGSGSHRFSGTIAGTRMSGTFSVTEFPQSGRFAVTRQ